MDSVFKPIKPPFPYFGGKSMIANAVWQRFGQVDSYIEPFLGSGAVLLANPYWENCFEVVNDIDNFIANAWRAIKHAPDEVLKWADYPIVEADLHARHCWLITKGRERIVKCASDPDFYDAKVAGWWLWGISTFLGSGWCSGKGFWTPERLEVAAKLGSYDHASVVRHTSVLQSEVGVTRKITNLSTNRGIHRKLPYIGNCGVHRFGLFAAGANGLFPHNVDLEKYFKQLAIRLRNVRVACGDWERVTSFCVMMNGQTNCSKRIAAVFFDPPYSASNREKRVYEHDDTEVVVKVRDWCLRHGSDPRLRIALCGYEGEGHEILEKEGWSAIQWKTAGGYSNQRKNGVNKNRFRERIWFSPHCLPPPSDNQTMLFSADEQLEETPQNPALMPSRND